MKAQGLITESEFIGLKSKISESDEEMGVSYLQEPRAFFGIRAWLRSTNDFES